MVCKGPGDRFQCCFTALTASTNSAINQLLMRPEILTSVECDHGRLLIPSLKRNERSHTQKQIDYDLDGPIKWKSRGHVFIKVPCPFGAMCKWTRKPVARGESNGPSKEDHSLMTHTLSPVIV